MNRWTAWVPLVFGLGLTLVLSLRQTGLRRVFRPAPMTDEEREQSRFARKVMVRLGLGLFAFFVLVFTGGEIWERWIYPTNETFRERLLEAAIPALQCPASSLSFEQVDGAGVVVKGCGHSARFFLLRAKGKNAVWIPDTGCRSFNYFFGRPC